MYKPTCIIIEDQPIAKRIIERHIADSQLLELKGTFSSALNGLTFLNENNIDIVFLDIEMPLLNGIQMLKTLKNMPLVIITTAYREYALEGYELNVIDFLLKPISLERFVKAVNKCCEILKLNKRKSIHERKFIVVKQDKIFHKINFESIEYIESMGDYAKFFTKNGIFIAHQSIKKLTQELSTHCFIKIHKSYIVNLNAIKAIQGNTVVLVENTILPIGESFRSKIKQMFS